MKKRFTFGNGLKLELKIPLVKQQLKQLEEMDWGYDW